MCIRIGVTSYFHSDEVVVSLHIRPFKTLIDCHPRQRLRVDKEAVGLSRVVLIYINLELVVRIGNLVKSC